MEALGYRKLIVFVISFIFIFLILVNISMQDVINGFISIGFKTFAVCLLIRFIIYFLRSVNMAVFLNKEVPFIYLLNAHLIHNFYLNIMPANIGEFSLPILLSKVISKSRSFSVLIVTRVFSVIIMSIFFLISVFMIFHKFNVFDMNTNYIAPLAITSIMIFLIVSLMKKSGFMFKVGFLKKIKLKIARVMDNLLYIMKNELKPVKLFFLIISILAYAFFLVLFYQIILNRLNISLSWIQLFFIMTIQMAVFVLPIKSLGGFGTTEGSWLVGMMVLGIDRKLALESGFIIHIIVLLSASLFFIVGTIGKYFMDKNRLYEKICNK